MFYPQPTFLTLNNSDFNPNSAVSLPVLTYNKLFFTTVYVAFRDTQKAFNTVRGHRDGLMYKLHRLGRLWIRIDDRHTGTSCSVVVNYTNSVWFPVSRGVRQGGKLLTSLYLVSSMSCSKESKVNVQVRESTTS